MKKLFLISSFIFVFLCAQAQKDNQFVVLSVSGNVSKKDGKSWFPVSASDKLTNRDEIKLEEKSSIALVHESLQKVVISEKGTHALDELHIKLSKDEKSNAAVLKFVWNQLNLPHTDVNEYFQKYTDSKGGTSRDNPVKMVFPMNNSKVAEQFVTFRWKPAESPMRYIIEIFLKDEKDAVPYLSFASNDTAMIINLKTIAFSGKQKLYWRVGTSSSVKSFSLWMVELNQDKADELREKGSLLDRTKHGPAGKLEAAVNFEESGLYAEAETNYRMAFETSQKDDMYKMVFFQFLTRIGKFSEAVLLMNRKD